MVTVFLLVCGVCVDRGGEPDRAATALPPGSAGAAAAVPGDPGAATAAAPDGSDDAPAAPPRPSREPGPQTGTSRAPASRTAATPAPGPDAAGSRTARPRGLGSPTPAPSTGAQGARHQRPPADVPGARHQRPAPDADPNRTATPTARPSRPPVSPRPLPPSRATRLLIPYLSVDAPVMGLGLDRDGRLTAPPEDDPKLVGWYKHGASPGEQGTAVAVGHLDTDTGPAVFAGLTQLKPGLVVKARRADGRIAVYTVDKIKSYEKAHFPSKEVYGARSRPELRLITCGGNYDRRKGYSGNVVVFAHLTGVR
ncbi:Sortase family protein [Streptomyces chartreusis NRRL 3882]|uniref:Sortase family protein n=1 Tax=Streptomyces chartreusis NRRL 3882 TaxID=1079985 RepID=A0A2N9BHV8_STRCX|nr:Sortase family protein [Streptomyces chartreusis NRRL 3882]